jgi:hypothetical protein
MLWKIYVLVFPYYAVILRIRLRRRARRRRRRTAERKVIALADCLNSASL